MKSNYLKTQSGVTVIYDLYLNSTIASEETEKQGDFWCVSPEE